MRKSVTVDIPVIEDIRKDPYEQVMEYLKENKVIISPIACKILDSKVGGYILSKMEDEGMLKSAIKMVKVKGDTQHRSMRVYEKSRAI